METVKEDASETSRDFLKNKPERKVLCLRLIRNSTLKGT